MLYEELTQEELEELMCEDMRIQMEEAAERTIRFPAKSPLDGWYWKEVDGCGALYDSEGHPHFEYDRNSYNSCGYLCEYRSTKTNSWKTFDGTMDEFYRYAEKLVMEK